MSDYRYLETSGLRATEVAATLRALESYTPAGTGTVVLVEPFNNLTNWTTIAGTPSIVTGLNGTGVAMAGGTPTIQYTIPAINEAGVLTLAFAWKIASILTVNVAELLSDAGVTSHNLLTLSNAGVIAVTRAGFGNVAASAAGVIAAANTWYQIEWRITLGDAAGTTSVKVNGTQVLSGTGLDTKNAGTKTVYDRIRLRGPTSTTSTWDDLTLTMGA